jgi:hypothetical protein
MFGMRDCLRIFSVLLFVFGFIVFLDAPCYADTAFVTGDLQGIWYGCAISTGTNFGWYFSTATIDGAGNFSRSITNNLNQNVIQRGIEAIDSNGIITNLENPSTNGVMNSNKNIIVTTFGRKGSFVIRVSVKAGAVYSTADLQGTWNVLFLRVGNGFSGTGNGTLTCDASGNCSFSSGGNVTASVFNVTSNGIVTIPAHQSFQGALSSDKNFGAAVESHGDGSVELDIITRSGANFSAGDQQGTWVSHLISTNPTGWGFGTELIDASGNLTAVETGSDGSVSPLNAVVNIDGNGLLTAPGDVSFYGVLSSDKSLTVGVDGSSLSVGVKGNSLSNQYSVAVNSSGTGTGTVTSSPAGINCGAVCLTALNAISDVTLTAASATGDGFVGWIGGGWGCSGSQGACSFGLTSNNLVTANFAKQDFFDAPVAPPFFSYIEAIYQAGITQGCGSGNYCPSMPVLRNQMAAFIVRALHGDNPTCKGGIPCSSTAPYFADVPSSDYFFKYVQKLHEDGITTGCGNGNYCPTAYVTRDEMAAFMVRAEQVQYGHNPEGFSCSGGTICATTMPYFNDVPSQALDGLFKYVQRLYEEGITVGCGNGNYCPAENVTRDQMAAFLSRAFLGMK